MKKSYTIEGLKNLTVADLMEIFCDRYGIREGEGPCNIDLHHRLTHDIAEMIASDPSNCTLQNVHLGEQYNETFNREEAILNQLDYVDNAIVGGSHELGIPPYINVINSFRALLICMRENGANNDKEYPSIAKICGIKLIEPSRTQENFRLSTQQNPQHAAITNSGQGFGK